MVIWAQIKAISLDLCELANIAGAGAGLLAGVTVIPSLVTAAGLGLISNLVISSAGTYSFTYKGYEIADFYGKYFELCQNPDYEF